MCYHTNSNAKNSETIECSSGSIQSPKRTLGTTSRLGTGYGAITLSASTQLIVTGTLVSYFLLVFQITLRVVPTFMLVTVCTYARTAKASRPLRTTAKL